MCPLAVPCGAPPLPHHHHRPPVLARAACGWPALPLATWFAASSFTSSHTRDSRCSRPRPALRPSRPFCLNLNLSTAPQEAARDPKPLLGATCGSHHAQDPRTRSPAAAARVVSTHPVRSIASFPSDLRARPFAPSRVNKAPLRALRHCICWCAAPALAAHFGNAYVRVVVRGFKAWPFASHHAPCPWPSASS